MALAEMEGSGKSDATLQLDAIFRAFPDLLFSMDAEGTILEYRAGKASALHMPQDKLLGRKMQDILPLEIGVKFTRALRESLRTGKVVSIEYDLSVSDERRSFEARLCTLYQDRVVAIIRDVTEKVRSAEQVHTQIRRLSALHSIDTAITSSFDLNITLSVILRQLINQLGIDAVDILLFNPATHMLEFVAGQGFQVKNPQPVSLMIGQGYAGKAALERRTISVPNLNGQTGNLPPCVNLGGEKFANYCAIPLIAKGQVKGVLEVYQRAPVSVDDEWLDFLATMAAQAAVAIDSSSLFQDLQRTNAELSQAYDATIESWSQVLEMSNRESAAHAHRVVELTLHLARSMGVSEESLIHYRRGALLHDVGKLAISESLLNKPGPLTEAERKLVQNHALLAYQLLSSVHYLLPALDIPHYHHERWDGSGYPEGLSGDQIPFPARLFAVVDVYDAITSIRPYRSAWPRASALDYIEQHSSILFDPQVVKRFLWMMRES